MTAPVSLAKRRQLCVFVQLSVGGPGSAQSAHDAVYEQMAWGGSTSIVPIPFAVYVMVRRFRVVRRSSFRRHKGGRPPEMTVELPLCVCACSNHTYPSHCWVCAAILCPFNRKHATSLQWWALWLYFYGGCGYAIGGIQLYWCGIRYTPQ